MDVLSSTQRRLCMSRNRGRDTGPEMLLRRALWREGYRYRVQSDLPGKPDVVFPRNKLAIFVDGCFWHSCPEHGASPKTNSEFWHEKLDRTVERDKEVSSLLKYNGWHVIRLWEHEIKQDLDLVVGRVATALGRDT